MSTARTRPPAPPTAGEPAPSTIGSTVNITGQIISDQDLFVDGHVDGSIDVPGRKLTIGPAARVKAAIKAGDVVIIGNAEGNIAATGRVELGPQCRVLGDIRTARIVVQDGAHFKGQIDIVKPTQSSAG